MKITVDLPDSELREITHYTGIEKKGPAIRKLVSEALSMKRRAEISSKFLAGEWSAELEGYEAGKATDRQETLNFAQAWRD
jgi:hypothetical protein